MFTSRGISLLKKNHLSQKHTTKDFENVKFIVYVFQQFKVCISMYVIQFQQFIKYARIGIFTDPYSPVFYTVFICL